MQTIKDKVFESLLAKAQDEKLSDGNFQDSFNELGDFLDLSQLSELGKVRIETRKRRESNSQKAFQAKLASKQTELSQMFNKR